MRLVHHLSPLRRPYDKVRPITKPEGSDIRETANAYLESLAERVLGEGGELVRQPVAPRRPRAGPEKSVVKPRAPATEH
jgi:hypothetical protein